MDYRITFEQIQQKAKENNIKALRYINNFKGGNTLIEFQCSCKNIFQKTYFNWDATTHQLCNKCANKSRSKNHLGLKIGTEPANKFTFQYVKEEINKFEEITLLSKEKDYKSSTKLLEFKCSCNKIFNRSFYKLKMQTHKCCSSCAKKRSSQNKIKNYKFSVKKIKKYVASKGSKFISNKWKGYKTKHTFKCIICNKTYQTTLCRFKQGGKYYCPTCGIKIRNQKKVKYNFKEVQKKIKQNRSKLISTKYINSYKSLIIECQKCKKHYKQSFSGFQGSITKMCGNCSKGMQTSTQELEIQEFLKQHNIKFIANDREIIKPRELDIYIPDKNIAIEYDSLYWHSIQMNGNKNYHLEKTKACENKEIQLIHIFENEWLFDRKKIESILKYKLGLITNKIGARKLTIKENTKKEENVFLEENHLQGKAFRKISYGLYKNNELLSVLTLGKPRFNKHYEWEIIRFATKNNIVIPGALSKLFTHFIKEQNPKSIITYVDRRYGNGKGYEKIRFKKINETEPSYYYFKSNKTLFHRAKFQKHKLPELLENFSDDKTEELNMFENGWNAIYDCGTLVYEWR